MYQEGDLVKIKDDYYESRLSISKTNGKLTVITGVLRDAVFYETSSGFTVNHDAIETKVDLNFKEGICPLCGGEL